jgi:hypothetical protein
LGIASYLITLRYTGCITVGGKGTGHDRMSNLADGNSQLIAIAGL